MANEWMSGIQVGANIAGQALDRNMRMQELRSQLAHQQFQERQQAQQTQMLLEESMRKAQEFKTKIQADAEASIAFTDFMAATQPANLVPGIHPDDVDGFNRAFGVPKAQAALKFLGPVAAKYGGVKGVESLLTNVAMDESRSAAAQRSEIAGRLDQKKLDDFGKVTPVQQSTIDLNKLKGQAIEKGRGQSFAPPALERMFDAAKSEGAPFSPEAKKLAREIHAGIKPRARMTTPVISEANYIARELPKAMKDKPTKKLPGKYWGTSEVEMTPDEVVASLRKQYQFITGPLQPDGESDQTEQNGQGSRSGDDTETNQTSVRENIKRDFSTGAITREQALQLLRATGLK